MDYADLLARVDAGGVVVIDGGTGTEIQRRGVAMNGETWCAEANIEEPEVVRDVHERYIAAGAELIIANTYATSPLLFDHLGRGGDVERIDRLAVELAQQASDGRVPVGGSISVMRPVAVGGDRNEVFRNWTEDRARDLFRRKAETMAATGVDVLVMEMMRDTDYSVWATEAAIATGLPVWVGIAVERAPMVGWSAPADRTAHSTRSSKRSPRWVPISSPSCTRRRTTPVQRSTSLARERTSGSAPTPRAGSSRCPTGASSTSSTSTSSSPGHADGSNKGRGSSAAAAGSRPTTSPASQRRPRVKAGE